jgi:D-tyrosyl-tRNA(Tyr) deacylase
VKAVIQRVSRASVTVENQTVAEIGGGLLILLGVGPADTAETAAALARKVGQMRIFTDEAGKMNLSVIDTHGSAIVVSQFTLYADARRGNRPSFTDAAPPDQASPLVDLFAQTLHGMGIDTGQGVFGAHMQVDLLNDGPVTILLEM